MRDPGFRRRGEFQVRGGELGGHTRSRGSKNAATVFNFSQPRGYDLSTKDIPICRGIAIVAAQQPRWQQPAIRHNYESRCIVRLAFVRAGILLQMANYFHS